MKPTLADHAREMGVDPDDLRRFLDDYADLPCTLGLWHEGDCPTPDQTSR